MKADNSEKIIRSIRPSRIFLPIVFGLGVSAYMIYQEYTPGSFSFIDPSINLLLWTLLSFSMMGIRDFGYILRIRLLTNKKLSWRQSLNTILLWEFTSAITPSAIGGTSVAIFFLTKEGIRIGRSTAVVMVTSFLDELYFIIAFPLIIWLIGRTDIFAFGDSIVDLPWFKNKFFLIALAGYSVKLIYTSIITYGLFVNPRGLKFLLLWLFKLPIIKKWRPQANESGSDLIEASNEFKSWNLKQWLAPFGATVLSWTARYWIVNTLIISFFGVVFLNWEVHILIFGKQLVMWIMMLITPTPGASGFAEYVFKEFLGSNIPQGAGTAMAFFWRLISYYPYLLIGTLIVPKWIKKHFFTRKVN